MAKSSGRNGTSGNGELGEAAKPEAAQAGEAAGAPQIDAETLKRLAPQIARVRAQVRESFGKIVMSMMLLPRYRNQTIADLQHLVLEPLIRDRVAIAYPGKKEDAAENELADVAGVAIWASVSKEVDERIREQIRGGTFPLRLKAEDWTSGDINWLIDVIAPNAKVAGTVIANFKQVVKDGSLHLHPVITRLVDEETLKKMGAQKMGEQKAASGAES